MTDPGWWIHTAGKGHTSGRGLLSGPGSRDRRDLIGFFPEGLFPERLKYTNNFRVSTGDRVREALRYVRVGVSGSRLTVGFFQGQTGN